MLAAAAALRGSRPAACMIMCVCHSTVLITCGSLFCVSDL